LLGRPEAGEEEQVGAGTGGGDRDLCGAAEVFDRRRFQGVGDRDALEAEPVAQLTGGDRAGEGRGPIREGRVDRGAEHHQLAPGGDEGLVGPLVDRPQIPLGEVDPFDREVGVFGRGAEAGEVLAGGGHAAGLQRLGEGDRGGFDPRCRRAEAAFGLGDDPAGPADVEHRGEIDVDAQLTQGGGGGATLPGAEGGAAGAHLAGGGGGSPADPLHQAALLVDHDQQRVAQLRRPLDLLQRGDQALARGATGEVLGEEDDTRHPARADRGAQTRGDRGSRQADGDPLAGELARRQGAGDVGLRPRSVAGTGAEGCPEGKRPHSQAGEQAQSNPPPSLRHPRHGPMLGVRPDS